jgi:hypothetical protein
MIQASSASLSRAPRLPAAGFPGIDFRANGANLAWFMQTQSRKLDNKSLNVAP